MTAKLNQELSDAVDGRDQVEAIDPATGRHFVLVEKSVFDLTCQREVQAAIQGGIEDMEAGRTMTAEESKRRTTEALDPYRQ
jgi:predicted transcriptional regulator